MDRIRLFACCAFTWFAPTGSAGEPTPVAPAIAAAVESIQAEAGLWPGFDPLSVPLAVFDGEHTYLFRHPAPPQGFEPIAGGLTGGHRMNGRHPAVTANSSTDIGGIATATLLVDAAADTRAAGEWAAAALHEAFHVFQRARHPGWAGDEAALFLYPVEDPELLHLRRLEMESLRRAFGADAPAACWTGAALDYRARRFGLMDPVFAAYERATELNEGLASYVQARANRQLQPDFTAAPLRATEIRRRAYVTGLAMALLLDRFAPGWAAKLEKHDGQHLDAMLTDAVRRFGNAPSNGCGFSARELADHRAQAAADAGLVSTTRKELRRAFDDAPGWRVVVEAGPGTPLWPQGFDPLNVERLGGELLHTRWLRLGNERGEMDAIDTAETDLSALTHGAGEHPLFNGVSRVEIAGLKQPELKLEQGRLAISAPGFRLNLTGVSVVTEGQTVIVDLRQR